MLEQRLYARWLDVGTRIAFVALVVSFLSMCSG